ncbi:MAG: hypothetical protein WC554_18525 [Clostridia bacterium]
MKLVIKSSEFVHLKDRSEYNHNYYQYTGEANNKFIIYEICHEDYDFCEYWIIDNETKMFLGCSQFDHIHDNAIVNIDFREYYT